MLQHTLCCVAQFPADQTTWSTLSSYRKVRSRCSRRYSASIYLHMSSMAGPYNLNCLGATTAERLWQGQQLCLPHPSTGVHGSNGHSVHVSDVFHQKNLIHQAYHSGQQACFLLQGQVLQEMNWFKQEYSSWFIDNFVLQGIEQYNTCIPVPCNTGLPA